FQVADSRQYGHSATQTIQIIHIRRDFILSLSLNGWMAQETFSEVLSRANSGWMKGGIQL
ncbi:MAG TPA: hypothetical protein DIV36_06550, partial [Verrucomicrobiales bacterium]|nr:hypothetical protein [Verrucomicrobiales bacterium]